MCSKVLSWLISRDVNRDNIHGVSLAPRVPGIFNLSFSDDVLLCCRAKLAEIEALMCCVNLYCS